MGGTGAGGRRGGSQTGRPPLLSDHGVDLTRGPCPLWRSPFSRPLGRARSTAHMGRPASGKGRTWARHSAVPHCGKKFSIAWKTAKNIFHSVEKSPATKKTKWPDSSAEGQRGTGLEWRPGGGHGRGRGDRGDQVAARRSAESDACTAFSALIQAMLTRWRRRGI